MSGALAPASTARPSVLADPLVVLTDRLPARRISARRLRAALRALALAAVPNGVPGGTPDGVPGGAPDGAARAERAVLDRYGAALDAEREAVRRAAADERFRAPAAFDPDGTAQAVAACLAGDAAGEERLAEAIARALHRGGPPTGHTALALGHWAADTEADADADADAEAGTDTDTDTAVPGPDPDGGRSALGLDRTLVSLAASTLLHPPTGTALPPTLRPNWTLRQVRAQARFHRRDGEQLRLVAVPVTRRIRLLLTLLESGALPTGRLIAELTARLDGDAAGAEQTVHDAVRAQLLVAGPVFDEQAADPLAEATALAADRDHPAAPVLAAIRAELDAARAADSVRRAEAVQHLKPLQARLNRLLTHPIRLHAVEEHTLPPVAVAPGRYRDALADLAAITAWAALFDRVHEARAMLTTAFVDRFGPGAHVPLVDHAADLVTMVGRRALLLDERNAADFGPADGSLAELLRLRADSLRHVTAGILAADGEARLAPGPLAAHAERLPERFRRPTADYAVLVRPGGAGLLTVEAIHPAEASPALRLADRAGLERTGARLAARAAAHGTVLVEDRGLHGVGHHHRPAVPGAAPFGAEDWLHVTLAHRRDTDELELLDRSGRPVQVLSAAHAQPERLPAPLKIALWLHGAGRPALDPLGTAAAVLRERGATDTLALPRLRVGRVVLQPARWYPGADLPQPAGPVAGPADLTALARWRGRHGVPDELVAVGPLPEEAGDPGVPGFSPADQAPPRRRRYVDLASALLASGVSVVGAGAANTAGWLEEALPGVGPGHGTAWMLEYRSWSDGPDRGEGPDRTDRTERG
ncbi:hypothetical protein [Kitasatospora sp. NPDC086791]|uniref:hypothetical protein n=1 Tax=Kitasatospora sp. NPDC086791 TaxID=3155178 RepID=UPI0034175653